MAGAGGFLAVEKSDEGGAVTGRAGLGCGVLPRHGSALGNVGGVDGRHGKGKVPEGLTLGGAASYQWPRIDRSNRINGHQRGLVRSRGGVSVVKRNARNNQWE